jgi:hypothetical protein
MLPWLIRFPRIEETEHTVEETAAVQKKSQGGSHEHL